MNKFMLSTLAVMTAVSICGMQPVDAKQVNQTQPRLCFKCR